MGGMVTSGSAARARRKRAGWLVAAVLLSLVLAGCDGGAPSARGTSTPTTTGSAPALAGATATPGITPAPPPVLPYEFPTAWQQPTGAPAGVGAFAFAPSNSQIGYACTGAVTQLTVPALYVTSDGGMSWQPVATGLGVPSGCGLWVDAANARDVFLQQLTAVTNAPPAAPHLLRSRDGGHTWQTLASITTLQQSPVAVMNLVVIGSRIVASTSIFGEGQLPDDLVKSDDGGASWQPLAQSIASQHLVVENFSAAGNTLYLQAEMPCTQCGASARLSPQHGTDRAPALLAPLSSQPPTPPVFWRSTDAGTTWTKTTAIPGTLPVFATQGTGSYYAGLSVAVPSPTAPVQYYTSNNGGTAWQQSIGLSGVEHGYVDATASPASGLVAIDATGTIVTDTWHDAHGQNGGNEAGYFYFPGASSASEWLPLAPPGVQSVALVPGGVDGRLWGIEGATTTGPALVYVNIP